LLSRAHVEVRIVGGDVVIVDRGSTNGVFLREPADYGWTRIAPWEQATWRPGAYLQIGGRILRLQVGTPPVAPRGPRVTMHHYAPRQAPAGRVAPGGFPID
jgi:RND superfamily putative drug exporter